MTEVATTRKDEALRKGAVEQDALHTGVGDPVSHNSLAGQLGHRDQDDMLKENDTDFPEPDAHAEHTGK
jgi:hypothetical protein